MHRHLSSSVVVATLLVAIAVGGSRAVTAQDATPAAETPSGAGAILHDTTGRVVGVALLAERSAGAMRVVVAGQGLAAGEHGLHIHETGACDPAGEKAFSSAGAHYNPSGAEHGGHAGDLGNITIDADGLGSAEIDTDQLTLAELLDADGAAIVIHADADANDPEGKSYGARSACGVLATAA